MPAAYAAAFLLTSGAMLLRASLSVQFGERPLLLLFLFPIALTAALGGAAPGLLATLLVAAGTVFYFIPPARQFAIGAPYDAVQWVMLIANGLLVSAISESLWRQRNRALERLQELQRTREALEHNETVLRQAQQLARLGHWSWDFRADRPVWSEEVYRIFGRDPAGPPADFKEVPRYYTPESWARLSAAVQRTIETGEAYRLDCEVVREDGERRWVDSRGEAVRGAGGEIAALRGMMQDVTERWRAEEALRVSEAHLRLFVAHAPAALAMFDRDMRYVAVSRRWRTDYGLGERTLEGVSHYDVFPELPAAWRAIHQRGLAGEVIRADEDSFARADGTVQWLRWEMRPWHDARGAVGGIVIFSEDVTERRRTEEALRESDATARALNAKLAGLQEVLARLATERSVEGIATLSCAAARRLTGADGATFSLRDGDGVRCIEEDAIAPLWKGRWYPLGRCPGGWVLQQGRLLSVEDSAADPHVPADLCVGTFVRSLLMVPVRAADPIGVVGVVWAARRRPSAEETEMLRALADSAAVAIENVQFYQLLDRRVQERTAELHAANRELDAFAYAVSHDLRAPLRAMNGFSQALLEDFGPGLPEGARQHLDEILRGSRRMGELIDGLLLLSRSTRGELRHEAVDLSALAARVAADLGRAEPARRVDWHIAPGLTASGDPRMIEVLLSNLLGNAWKYTAGRADARIEFGRGPAPDDDAFFVRDNGAGFDPRHAGRLFQPFQRLHREDEFPGLGIGLATVHRIVSRHGGAIRASSAPGAGATFRFTLAAAAPPETAP